MNSEVTPLWWLFRDLCDVRNQFRHTETRADASPVRLRGAVRLRRHFSMRRRGYRHTGFTQISEEPPNRATPLDRFVHSLFHDHHVVVRSHDGHASLIWAMLPESAVISVNTAAGRRKIPILRRLIITSAKTVNADTQSRTNATPSLLLLCTYAPTGVASRAAVNTLTNTNVLCGRKYPDPLVMYTTKNTDGMIMPQISARSPQTSSTRRADAKFLSFIRIHYSDIAVPPLNVVPTDRGATELCP